MSFFNQVINTDVYGFNVENTPIGEMRVIEPHRLVGTTYNNGVLDTNFWTTGATGTGAYVSQQNGFVTLSAGTSSAGTATIQSVRKARYIASYANRYRAQLTLDVANNHTNRWGAFDLADGCFFETSGTTWYAVTRSNSADTKVASTAWSANQTLPTAINVNTYEIYYTNKSVYFIINDVLMHKATSTTTPWSTNKDVPVRAESFNYSGTTNYNLNALVQTISRLGKAETDPTYRYISTNTTTVLKYGAGQLHLCIVTDNVGTITIYDNTAASGNIIATIDASKIIGTITFDAPFFNGLTVVTGTNAKCTIIYE